MFERLRRRRPPPPPEDLSRHTIDALEGRVTDLEVMIQGLQDAVHREAVRRDEQAARFERRLEPRELARALAEDARERGL
jgi:hypothetical protein